MAEQPSTEQPSTDHEIVLAAMLRLHHMLDGRDAPGHDMSPDGSCRACRVVATVALDELVAAGRLREARKPLRKLPPKERRAIRQAEADDRLRVDDPDREKLAGALHDIDCGWNCPGHGIVQEAQDRRYRRMADVALRTLARRLLPEGAKPCTFLEPGGCSGEWQAGRGCQGDGQTYYTGDEVMQLIRSREALREALADCVVKATEYGVQDGDFVASYILPTGPLHRAIPLLQSQGITVRPGFDGRKTLPDEAPVERSHGN